MLLSQLAAYGINGTYSDPGGGTYWCNVYVHDIAASKSYGWCTGDSEDGKMNEFREFTSEAGGKISTERPTFCASFRYNKKQSKDYDYKGSEQQIYVMTHDGLLHKIYDAPRNSNGTQTDYTYGVITASWNGEIFTFRIALNERGLKDVTAVQVESDSYFYQSNFWHRDYWFYIHARYLKGIDKNLSLAHEAKVDWIAPNKIKVSADNSWLPSSIGQPTDQVSSFRYATEYTAKVVLPSGGTYTSNSFRAENRGSGSVELPVPLDQNYTVSITRNTKTSFNFGGRSVTQNQNENAVSNVAMNSTLTNVQASFNQVDGEMLLQWTGEGINTSDGDYQIYRTELDENGRPKGKRELLGTSAKTAFTDNANYGMELNKTYRYEIFQQRKSWGDFSVPADAEKPIGVNAAVVVKSTAPVVPMHLVQDASATDVVKMDWTFGNIPKNENDITFKIHRIEPNGTIKRNYLDVTVPRNAGKATFSDEKPASNCDVYGYFVQLDLADNKVHLYSDTVYAHVLDNTTVTELDATKGTAGTEVVVKWKAHQVGTTPTLYGVQRRYIGSDDWVLIQETEGTNGTYTYTDKTAEPGRYYEYRVIAYSNDCGSEGRIISNMKRDVGFSRSSGVVSGRVQFESGTAVKDVRVSLSGDAKGGQTYHSRSVLEPGNAITVTGLKDIVGNGKSFTLQAYLRPDQSTEPMTLMELPQLLQLDYNTGNGMYDVKLNGVVTGNIPADEYSQLSLISDGNNLTTYVTGNESATNNETAAPQPMCYMPENDIKFYESGSSFDGWTLSKEGDNGWIIDNEAFRPSNIKVTAEKDFPIPDEIVGEKCVGSVTVATPWGADYLKVKAIMLDGDGKIIDEAIICDDRSKREEWKNYTKEFTISSGTKTLRYYIEGSDGVNWRGHYGPMFKEMSLTFPELKRLNGNWVLLPDYSGYIDEIRLWNYALTSEEIEADADRLISGETEGLKAYITFDEGLEEYAFDSSCTNGVPNGHHAVVGGNTRPSDVVPTDKQLSAYGMTNDRGEYEIRGISFTGSGTRYSVYPTKGVHSFNPTSRSAFIGGTSLTINNADFTDVSSFKVSGTVRYSGTTIPVDSVSFYVDGIPCNKNDKLILTNSNGEYEISVPIGSHYIEARRGGHTFEGAGRYPAAEGETYEFLSDTHLDFFDATEVIFAGRITGGETEGKKPLGYGVSQNTIGKAVIKLSSLDHPQRMINAVQKVEGATVEWVANSENVAVESSSVDIKSTAYRAGGDIDEAKYIYITTDEKTGEFCAKIPPIRYKVESVEFPNNPDVQKDEMFRSIAAVNLSNPNDTIIPDTLKNANKELLPLFKCNKKLLLTYRSPTVMDITQAGAPVGAFGTDTIVVTEKNKEIKLPIYDVNEATGEVKYNYGYPIFQMGRTYNFKIKAYEPYMNYDDGKGKLYKDVLRDSVITFDNELGAGAIISAVDTVAEGHTLKRGDFVKLTPEQVRLDSIGEGNYKWIAGVPSLTKPYTRTMNASMVINGATQLWNHDGLSAIIAGVIPTGNNFITAGPSHVMMVLRDPPGDGSYATWATDTITSDYTYTVRGVHNNSEFGVDMRASLEVDVMTGAIAFYKMTYNQIIHENAVSWKYDVNKTWDNHTAVTYTNSQSTSTNGTMNYVGRDGDVFIGYSTNYIIGAADKVGLMKQKDGSWGIGMEETMAMDEKFQTHFEYSQKYIETTLFNNIKRTRNTMLKHITSMSEIDDNPKVPTYYTFLPEDDKRYGTSNNDKAVWGSEAKDGYDGPSYYARFPSGYEGCDSVFWCNEIIQTWKDRLTDNEEDKLKAFANEKYKIGNESFERGMSFTKTTGSSTKEVHNFIETFSTNIAYRGKNGYLLDKMGAIVISNTDIGYHQTRYGVDETTTNERFSYTLNDTQRGNAHTIDIFNSPCGWSPIFRTRGGQTRCPYEGETKTQYYRPGQTLDYATMKLDNPHISMPVRNLTDIPAGQEAQIQVVFKNESEAHETMSSAFVIVDAQSNPDGLQIYMDGLPLAGGTEIWMEYGVPLVKTLTIKQSDHSILDYNDIKILLANSCKPGEWIYENVTFSAHFVPAAPDVTLKLDKSVLNQSAVASGKQLTATISDINRLFTGLKGVRLKYRFAGDAQWITAHEWLTDAKYFTEGHETDVQSLLPTDKPNVVYDLELPNFDGTYVIAAESMCEFGGKEYLNTTMEQTVVRDTRGPKLLGQAYPNTGILTPTDDIRIKFNEDIRESYLTKEGNFFITGSLNDAHVNHDVSLQFNGTPIETDAYLPISNTSFAASMWLKRKGGGTLIEHGTTGNNLRLAMTEAGEVVVEVNGAAITSEKSLPADKWVFLALNYVKGSTSENNTLTMLVAEDDKETMLFDEAIVPDYNGSGQLTLGRDYTGMMHELVIWNKNNPVRSQLGQKDEAVAPYLPGLVGYWKMNEGHGTVVTDYARGRNIHLPAESWNVENTNLAAHLDGTNSIKIPMGTISPRETDSYVVETWFRGEKGKNAGATLLSVTDKISVGFDYDNSLIMQIYNDTLSSLTTNGLPIILSNTDYNDGNWHHLALNVHRGVSAVAYLDGNAIKTMAEQDVPTPASDYMYIGSILKRDPEHEQIIKEEQHFTGDIDEVRIWNAACDGTSIIANRYNQMDTATVSGLVAYYPMEHRLLDANNNVVAEFSLANNAPYATRFGVDAALGEGVVQAATAPAMRTSPLKQNLEFDFTASSDEIYIDLNTLPSRMQGNLLTFIVKNVRDIHDNLSETITWSAVVDYNTLEWQESKIEMVKDRLTSMTFYASLRNKGRESTHYVISGLPSWIQVLHPSGVIALDEEMTMEFIVGADAPVGTHLIYAYAVNDDDICAPLLMQVTVRGNEPDWSVNPDDYESSMNIIGQIYFDDRICSNSMTKIAAFVGENCCGVSSPELMVSRDAYFVNMNVYGVEDVTKDKPITFRIYDAERGVVLGDVLTMIDGEEVKLNYRPNDLKGSYDNPVIWKSSDRIEQLCDFKTGWNWISLYVKPDKDKDDLESVFGHAKVFNTVKGKEGFAMNSGTKWAESGLSSMQVGKLYKVKVKEDIRSTFTGGRIDTETTTQTISNGWNWIGPLSIYNLSLAEAFANLNPTRGDIVKSKNQVAFFDGYKWEGDLKAVIPGMGYYYYSYNPEDVTFRYPTIDGSYKSYLSQMGRVAKKHSPFTPVDHHQFSDNMNVVAQVMVNDVPVDTLTVAAFIGDECRGVTTATEDGYYLLTIAGNASEGGQEVTFATVYKDKVVKLNETLTWYSDVIYGDLDEPTKLTISTSGIDEVQENDGRIVITPTIVRDLVKVHSGSLLKSVEVYSASGAMVEQVANIGDNMVSVNLSHLPNGVYFVEAVTLDNNKAVKRILKR